MAKGAARAATRTSPRGKQTRTCEDGVTQLTKDRSRTASKKKRKQVSEIAAAANNKRTKFRMIRQMVTRANL